MASIDDLKRLLEKDDKAIMQEIGVINRELSNLYSFDLGVHTNKILHSHNPHKDLEQEIHELEHAHRLEEINAQSLIVPLAPIDYQYLPKGTFSIEQAIITSRGVKIRDQQLTFVEAFTRYTVYDIPNCQDEVLITLEGLLSLYYGLAQDQHLAYLHHVAQQIRKHLPYDRYREIRDCLEEMDVICLRVKPNRLFSTNPGGRATKYAHFSQPLAKYRQLSLLNKPSVAKIKSGSSKTLMRLKRTAMVLFALTPFFASAPTLHQSQIVNAESVIEQVEQAKEVNLDVSQYADFFTASNAGSQGEQIIASFKSASGTMYFKTKDYEYFQDNKWFNVYKQGHQLAHIDALPFLKSFTSDIAFKGAFLPRSVMPSSSEQQEAHLQRIDFIMPQQMQQELDHTVANFRGFEQRAEAIREYFREHFTYVVDELQGAYEQAENKISFVLEQKAGDCDLVNQAYIAVCRHYGIPARLSVGYLKSKPDRVTLSDAHAWSEVLTNKGWVIKDATPPLQQNRNQIGAVQESTYTPPPRSYQDRDMSPVIAKMKSLSPREALNYLAAYEQMESLRLSEFNTVLEAEDRIAFRVLASGHWSFVRLTNKDLERFIASDVDAYTKAYFRDVLLFGGDEYGLSPLVDMTLVRSLIEDALSTLSTSPVSYLLPRLSNSYAMHMGIAFDYLTPQERGEIADFLLHSPEGKYIAHTNRAQYLMLLSTVSDFINEMNGLQEYMTLLGEEFAGRTNPAMAPRSFSGSASNDYEQYIVFHTLLRSGITEMLIDGRPYSFWLSSFSLAHTYTNDKGEEYTKKNYRMVEGQKDYEFSNRNQVDDGSHSSYRQSYESLHSLGSHKLFELFTQEQKDTLVLRLVDKHKMLTKLKKQTSFVETIFHHNYPRPWESQDPKIRARYHHMAFDYNGQFANAANYFVHYAGASPDVRR